MNPMIIIVLILAVAILLGFGAVWWKDRDRTHEQAEDGHRLLP